MTLLYPRRTAIAILSVVLVLAAAEAQAQRRAISEKDLFQFVWVADPQISPDGSQVAFVRATIDEKKDDYATQVWVAKRDGKEPPRALTAGTRDVSPRWSPDGRHLAFVRTLEVDGRPQRPQIYVMTMGAGEPRAITDMPRGAASPEWAPDNRTIAFTSGTTDEDMERHQRERRRQRGGAVNDEKADQKKEDGGPPRESDVRVITRAVYRANGVSGFGFVDPDRPAQIWTVTRPDSGAEPADPKRVTSGDFAAGSHGWSRDGSRILFVSDRRPEPYYLPRDSDLYSVSPDGGEPTAIASIDGSIGAWALSPDGARVAFVGSLAGSPERSYSQPDLYVSDVAGGTPRNVTEGYDFHIDGGLAGDQRAPRGSHPAGPVWAADGRSILIRVGEQGDTNLKRVDVRSGKVDAVTTGSHEVMSYTADAKGGRVAFVRSTPTVVGDLHVLDVASRSATKLTTFNDALFDGLTMNEAEEICYPSFDGTRIQGWILKPPSFNASTKYPMILEIHGGPHAAYGNTFTHEFQWMAAKGYVVLYTNPRGSSNYGQEFGNVIQFAYPGDDYQDLMAGVDALLKQGYVDETRMGVTGGSGGGLLTNWVVTQTNRFAAAVSQRDISDWVNFWYTADFTLFRETWFRRPPFQDPEDFARRSPITHVEKIQTPLAFITSDEDWRTPASAGSEPLFRALKYLKRPTAMVRFPNEHHDLSRSGKPWHRVERLQHIVWWFDKWLLGQDVEAYRDVVTTRPDTGATMARPHTTHSGR
ncbi:MAG: S9 family peptidase [Acidobacteria bacterium]|nr:S9 family peptidase [Acidobacteriota bacterium]